MSNISLNQLKQVDLEKIPVEEVFTELKCSRDGLTHDEGKKRLEIFGPNKLEEKKANSCLLCFFYLFVLVVLRR